MIFSENRYPLFGIMLYSAASIVRWSAAASAWSRSPMIDSIKVVRRGKVRRAKLYYLRGRRGKSARIIEKQERQTGHAESSEASASKAAE